MTKGIRIAFVRRGYSRSGGAEAYLKRLGEGVVNAGHDVQLVTTNEWPKEQWPFGSIKRLEPTTVIGFADELEKIRPQLDSDLLLSLERVWSCDVYRAGDGVHPPSRGSVAIRGGDRRRSGAHRFRRRLVRYAAFLP